jgi:hypothetical protein
MMPLITFVAVPVPEFVIVPDRLIAPEAVMMPVLSEKSRCVLYRASSTSVYAAIAGLRPFYVRREGELSVDALDALQSWKKRVGTPAELVSMMKWDAEQDDAARAAEAAEAVAFCEKYFMPLDLNPLFEALPPAAGRVSSGIR